MFSKDIDILCMGEAMVEFTRVEDPTGRPLYLRGLGGDTSNCAISAARQGANVGYLSAVGKDQFGRIALDVWLAEGVDVAGVMIDVDAPTGVYFIEPEPEGRNFTYYRSGSAASKISACKLPYSLLEQASIFHLSGISQAISETAREATFAAIDIVKKNNGKISYDTNLRLNLWSLDDARSTINTTAELTDILLPSLDEAKILTGLEDLEDIVEYYLAFNPEILALKCGEKGAVVAFDGKQEHIPALKVAAVDASGAGDAFDGAFLARIVAGDNPFNAGRYAVAASGISVQGYGAVTAIPTQQQVLLALSE